MHTRKAHCMLGEPRLVGIHLSPRLILNQLNLAAASCSIFPTCFPRSCPPVYHPCARRVIACDSAHSWRRATKPPDLPTQCHRT